MNDSARSAGFIQSSSLTTATRSKRLGVACAEAGVGLHRVALDVAGLGAEQVEQPHLSRRRRSRWRSTGSTASSQSSSSTSPMASKPIVPAGMSFILPQHRVLRSGALGASRCAIGRPYVPPRPPATVPTPDPRVRPPATALSRAGPAGISPPVLRCPRRTRPGAGSTADPVDLDLQREAEEDADHDDDAQDADALERRVDDDRPNDVGDDQHLQAEQDAAAQVPPQTPHRRPGRLGCAGRAARRRRTRRARRRP